MEVQTTSQGLATLTRMPLKPLPTMVSAKVRAESVVLNSSPSRLVAASETLPAQLTMMSQSARSS